MLFKLFLITILGVLLYNSPDSRLFISDQLYNLSEIIRPEPHLYHYHR